MLYIDESNHTQWLYVITWSAMFHMIFLNKELGYHQEIEVYLKHNL